jgi:hypothetical protein
MGQSAERCSTTSTANGRYGRLYRTSVRRITTGDRASRVPYCDLVSEDTTPPGAPSAMVSFVDRLTVACQLASQAVGSSMTTPRPTSDTGRQRMAEARASRLHDESLQRGQAARAVNSHATDPQDRATLMAMLGLDTPTVADPHGTHVGRIN